MTGRERASSLLGLPDYVSEVDRQAIVEALTTVWSESMGRPPGNLEEDLQASRTWFDPVAQGHRLRREIAHLPSLPDDLLDPGSPLTVEAGQGRRLITPEGRCALEVLSGLDPTRPGHVIADSQLVKYDRRLALLYRDWSRHRLNTVLDLLAGESKPLQIPAAGVVIALLVNRCDDESRALTRFAGGEARGVVNRAFFAPVDAFADVLSSSGRRDRTNPRLVSGWMLYEARRRLGEGLEVVDSRGGKDGKVWIKPDKKLDVIDRVARDLARGHRARATEDTFSRAYDALVAALRESLPSLAGFGLVYERPKHTSELRALLLAGLSRHLSAE